MVMDLTLRINLNILAERQGISEMQLRFFKLGLGQTAVKKAAEEQITGLIDKSISRSSVIKALV